MKQEGRFRFSLRKQNQQHQEENQHQQHHQFQHQAQQPQHQLHQPQQQHVRNLLSKRYRNLHLLYVVAFFAAISLHYKTMEQQSPELAFFTSEKGRVLPAVMDFSDIEFLSSTPARHKTESDTFASFEKDSEAPFAIFYNIRVAEQFSGGKENKVLIGSYDNSTLTTIAHQLEVVRKSYAGSFQNNVLYYNTVGSYGVVGEQEMKSLCAQSGFSKDRQCVNKGHHEKMSEQHIFQNVYDYCAQHESHSVIYLKTAPGFLHWNNRTRKQQYWWRHHLTAAATSEACLKSSPSLEKQCHVCGLQFAPIPAIAFPGNIWSAKCSYVRRLIDPADFNERVADVIEAETRLSDQNRILMTLYEPRYSWSRGTRPAHIWEQWITSHPSVVPCDLSNATNVQHWFIESEKASAYEWSLAPRRGLMEEKGNESATVAVKVGDWFQLNKNKTIELMNRNEVRLRDYFLMAGNLVKWFGLYNTAPPASSWVWSWFPDNTTWKDAVQQHGKNAVDEMFSHGLHFPENMTTSTPFAIFYNIYVDPADKRRIENALNIVEEQIAQVGKSFANHYPGNRAVKLYYSTVGGPIHRSWMLSLCRMHGVDCHFLQHWNEGDEDVTLQRIHDYCGEHISNSVAYIHSKGSYHSEDMDPMWSGQNRWRRHMTDAVLTKDCLEPSNSTCNVCGLLFQPIPSEHFPGNMWTAKCQYIRQLSPPGILRLRRTRAIQAVNLIMKQDKMDRTMDAKFCPYDPLLLGLSRFFAEHWIGTHPSIRPCDLSASPSLEFWKFGDRDASDHSFSMAPRHSIEADWDFYNYCNNSQIMDNDEDRLKEYFLLPGHLFRWIKEYNQTAPDDSWIWTWYPDGLRWKTAIRRNWAKAFNIVTKQQQSVAASGQTSLMSWEQEEFRNALADMATTQTKSEMNNLRRQVHAQQQILTPWKPGQARQTGSALVAMVSKTSQTPSHIAMSQRREERTASGNTMFKLSDNSKVFNSVTPQRQNQATVAKSNKADTGVLHLADTRRAYNVITNQGRDETVKASNEKASIAHKVFRHAEANKAINIVSRYKEEGVN